jgi:hypothetical protein
VLITTALETDITEDSRLTGRFSHSCRYLNLNIFPPAIRARIDCLTLWSCIWTLDRVCHSCCGNIHRRGYASSLLTCVKQRLTKLVGTWYAFKYAFRRKAIKLERSNLNYGSLARLTRDGGFLVC